MTTSTSQFQPLAIVHFDELSVIWENDRRIPSPASRRAWAVARNLNPVNVHSWWYRRKAVAKKLRFRIPKGTYELEVGTPPVVEPVVKAEIVDSEMAQCKSECDDDPGEEHCSLVPSDGQSSATTLFSSLPPSSPILRPSSATSASGRAYSPREAGKPTDSHDFCSTNSTTRPNSTSIVDICVRLKLDSPFQRSSDSDMVCSGGGDPSSPFTCVLCTLHEAVGNGENALLPTVDATSPSTPLLSPVSCLELETPISQLILPPLSLSRPSTPTPALFSLQDPLFFYAQDTMFFHPPYTPSLGLYSNEIGLCLSGHRFAFDGSLLGPCNVPSCGSCDVAFLAPYGGWSLGTCDGSLGGSGDVPFFESCEVLMREPSDFVTDDYVR